MKKKKKINKSNFNGFASHLLIFFFLNIEYLFKWKYMQCLIFTDLQKKKNSIQNKEKKKPNNAN